jgi:ATP-dependent helicase/DNAse subunit B
LPNPVAQMEECTAVIKFALDRAEMVLVPGSLEIVFMSNITRVTENNRLCPWT